ncbi:efflux RND transporter periplasmic adaptor subunit [Roseivirga sp. BDSF3-8]|uniref:efflux RND transporter periplasmic adaptor subunit n=1 Tax=Roseivirga sp. BDSF3-8 TaxID=3241598 RepID=UPI003531C7C6
MKKVLTIVAVIAVIGLVAFQLMRNKEEMAESAKLAERVSDFIPVQLGEVELKRPESVVQPLGTFEAITDLTILSQTSGVVTRMYHRKGETVKKGDLLAQVENGRLQAQVDAAKANYEKLKVDEERFEKLYEKEAVTKRQLEDVRIGLANANAQYEIARKQLADTYIRATTPGTINEDYFQQGSNITMNAKLYDIVDVSKLYLNVKVTANNIMNVQEGSGVTVTTDQHPGAEYRGKVTAVAAKADASMKYNVEILLDNDKEKPLKAGMFGKAEFPFRSADEGLYINRDALTGSIKDPTVFVVKDGKAQRKKIVVGEIFDSEVEVIKGLEQGDQVVVNGQINLKEGTKVKPVNAGNGGTTSPSKAE